MDVPCMSCGQPRSSPAPTGCLHPDNHWHPNDEFGTTCIDCGEAIDDFRPTAHTIDGELIHVGCGDLSEEPRPGSLVVDDSMHYWRRSESDGLWRCVDCAPDPSTPRNASTWTWQEILEDATGEVRMAVW